MVIVRFSRVWRAVLRMGHPLVRWSMQMMTHDGGKTTQFQGDHEGCRGSTTKFGGMCFLRLLFSLSCRFVSSYLVRGKSIVLVAQGCFCDTHMQVIKMVYNFLGTCCDILLTVKNP